MGLVEHKCRGKKLLLKKQITKKISELLKVREKYFFRK